MSNLFILLGSIIHMTVSQIVYFPVDEQYVVSRFVVL